jgi:SAM-dependent methyltransferase
MKFSFWLSTCLPANNMVWDFWRFSWQLINGFRISLEASIAERRQQDIVSFLAEGRPLRVLDLANGRLQPQYLLLQRGHHQVFGIDLINRPERYDWRDLAYRVARWLLARQAGLSASQKTGKGLICGDVRFLPVPDNCFDLATSVAAFEHFLDVPAVVAELFRVLRPGGLAWIAIHLFTCPSGGHNVSLCEIPLRTIPKGIEPWDHLRQRSLSFHVPLNEWRRDQYLEAFSHRFQILKSYCALREGEELLTPELERELSPYSRDELTCGNYVILARKPPTLSP